MPPGYLQLFPSFQCNRRCGFCFNRGVDGRPVLGLAGAKRLAAVAACEGIAEIDILGGEPTLYPFLDGLLESFAGRGVRMHLSSNGTDPVGLARLSAAYPSGVLRIGVSITSDEIPEALHEYIVRFSPLLKSVCTRNARMPAAVKRLLGLPGIRYFHLFMDTLRPEDLGEAMPYFVYREVLDGLHERHPNVEGLACAGFVPDTCCEPELAGVRCPAGTTKLSIMPDGSVYPCYLLFRHPEFRLGNILEDDFAGIWRHPVLSLFRHFEGNPCMRTDCRFFGDCHGGCPALALLISGDLAAPDPRCTLPR